MPHPRQPARLRRANRVQEDRTHHGRSQAFTAPATSHPPIESIRRTQTEPPHPGQLLKLFRFLPGWGSAGSWRHQDDTGTVAPRKPTSSRAPADRKALARSRLLNGKDLLRTSAAPRPRNDQSVRFNLTQPDVSIIRAPPQGASGTKLSSGPCPSTPPQRAVPLSSGNGELAHRAAAWSESRKLGKSRLWRG